MSYDEEYRDPHELCAHEIHRLQTELARLLAKIAGMEEALRPFAEISLHRDESPQGPDMIEGPDLYITPTQVRAARSALSSDQRDQRAKAMLEVVEAAEELREVFKWVSVAECAPFPPGPGNKLADALARLRSPGEGS